MNRTKMKSKCRLILVMLMVWALPALVFAQKAAQKAPQVVQQAGQAWWQTLLYTVIQIALAVVIPVLGYAIFALLQKWGINVEKDQVDKIAAQAATWADQKAAEALKQNGKKTPGAEKMQLALQFGKKLAEDMKLKEKATKFLQERIEAAVAKKNEEKNKQLDQPKDNKAQA